MYRRASSRPTWCARPACFACVQYAPCASCNMADVQMVCWPPRMFHRLQVITHKLPLKDAPHGFKIFNDKQVCMLMGRASKPATGSHLFPSLQANNHVVWLLQDGCVKVILKPWEGVEE